MRFLFPAITYPGLGHILPVLAVAALASAIGVPASTALASADRARAVAGVMAATAALTVVLVWVLMTGWGLLGAAYALLVAEVVGSLGRWGAFLALVPGSAVPSSVAAEDTVLAAGPLPPSVFRPARAGAVILARFRSALPRKPNAPTGGARLEQPSRS